jgi:hypothetical protein
MKKVVIAAIAVLFLLVSFEYASAQQPNLGGKLTGLSLKVTYQQELVPKDPAKQSEGDKLVTKTSGIKAGAKYDPVLYIEVDPNTGNPLEIDFFWKNPKSGIKILTISCPFPATISSTPMISTTRPPATVTSSFKGFEVCRFCPDGINTGTLCNSGEPAGLGILYVEGTFHEDTVTQIPNSVSISGGVDGTGFNYLGEDDWASTNCTLYPDFTACPAIFQGSFGATLKPCPEIDPLGDPQCTNL